MNYKLYTVLFLGLLFSVMLPQKTSAQWVKQSYPSLEGELIYYLFAADKNTMWTYTRSPFTDTTHIQKSEFLRTGDGGKTYKKGTLSNNDIGFYPHIQPFDGKTAHLISTDADGHFTFKRTVDTGATWQDMPYQPKTFPDLVYFWDKDNGIFISDPDSLDVIILYTTNGGNTYTRLPQTNHPRMGATEYPVLADFQVVGNTFFFWSVDYITNVWRVWRSLDRGRNWTAGATFETGNVPGFTPRLAFTDNNNGLLLRGIGSNYLKPLYTEDGGATWKESSNLPSYTTWAIKNIPNTQNIMAFFQDTVRKMMYSALTNDLGKTWNSRKDLVPYTLDSIFTPFDFPPFIFTNLDIISNNMAWGRFSRKDIYRYESTTLIVPEKPDLDLELTADNNGLPLWGSVKFTLTIKNRGISKATGIKANWLPPYKRTNNGAGPFAYQAAYASKGQYDSWNGIWSINELQPGETQTATFHLFVLQNSTKVSQTAQIIAENEQDLDSAPNNMTTTVREDDEVAFTSVANATNFAEPENNSMSPISFKAFPNPTNDKVTAYYKLDYAEFVTFTLSDVNGRIVYEKMTPSVKNGAETISLQDLPKGVYVLKMATSTEIKTEKIVRQ